jgi:hypothetical protein
METDNERDRLEDINKHCLDHFRSHWKCLERNNQQMWNCRGPEVQLNKCVYDNLVSQSHYAKLDVCTDSMGRN